MVTVEIAEGQKKGEQSIYCPSTVCLHQQSMQRQAPLFLVRELAGTFICHSTKGNPAKPRMKTPATWVSLQFVTSILVKCLREKNILTLEFEATVVFLSPFRVL